MAAHASRLMTTGRRRLRILYFVSPAFADEFFCGGFFFDAADIGLSVGGGRVCDVMKNRTVTITVAASFEDVFSYLSNPETLPEWAYTFSKEVKPKEGAWEVTTPQGMALAFAIEADRASGCIDMMAGPTLEQMETFPIRVYKADSGETAASFTMYKSARPDLTDTMFEGHYRQLVKEVEGLIEQFGGGEISKGLPEGGKLLPGLIVAEMGATRDFYVSHFGFKAVFDGPCYVHLVRESSGDQLGLMAASAEAGQAEFETATTGAGLWFSLMVEDVDAEFERLKAEGVPVREEPKDQPWGERTSVFVDPNGVLIYVSQQTGKMDPSLQQYMVCEEAMAGA